MKRFVWILIALLVLTAYQAGAEATPQEATYQRALEFAEKGNYDIAIELFDMLGDYSDSAAQAIICRDAKMQALYDRALALFDMSEFDAAKEVFLMLGDYSDSAVQAIRCDTQKKQGQYDLADALAAQGEYQKACDVFRLLGDYSDSAARAEQMVLAMTEGRYNEAKALEAAGQFEEAMVIYAELGDYSDAKDHIAECQRQIYIAGLDGSIESALQEKPFAAEKLYGLLEEAAQNGLDEAKISDWFQRAYDLETKTNYAEQAVWLDEDVDMDGTDERLVASDGALFTLARTPKGLAALSAVDAARYGQLSCEKDAAGRKYLLAGKEDGQDIYLLQETPMLIASIPGPAGELSLEFTATGFMTRCVLTQEPMREQSTEYIVLDGEHVSVVNYPLTVDLAHYPAITDAAVLVKYYAEAILYNSEEEIALLTSDQADPEELAVITQWLVDHGGAEKADCVVWNADTREYICRLSAGEDRLYISVVQKEDGQMAISGAA